MSPWRGPRCITSGHQKQEPNSFFSSPSSFSRSKSGHADGYDSTKLAVQMFLATISRSESIDLLEYLFCTLKTARRRSWGRQWHAGQQQQESRRQVHRNAWRKESHLLATKHSDFRPMELNLGRNEPPVSQSVGRQKACPATHQVARNVCLQLLAGCWPRPPRRDDDRSVEVYVHVTAWISLVRWQLVQPQERRGTSDAAEVSS
uniref:Uncharacterized protein n=1 Tax=Zea mays TaxID=4577 RepID=B7ZZG1_MAIZE|nr:unknown [Zea mays]